MSAPDDIRQWEKIDKLCDDMTHVKEDIAFIKGKLEGSGAPVEGSQWINKQNGIAVALAGLITTIGTVITSVFTSR